MTVRSRALPSRPLRFQPPRQLAATLLCLGLSIGGPAPALAAAPADTVVVEETETGGAQETVVRTDSGEGFPWGLLGLLGLFGLARRRGAKIVYLPAEASPQPPTATPAPETEQEGEAATTELDMLEGEVLETEVLEPLEPTEAEMDVPEPEPLTGTRPLVDTEPLAGTGAQQVIVSPSSPPPTRTAKAPYAVGGLHPDELPLDGTEDDDYLDAPAAPPFMQRSGPQPRGEYGGGDLEEWEELDADLQPLEEDELDHYPTPPRRR